MRLRGHTVLVFIILWIVTLGSAETAPGSDASNPFSLPAANTRQLRPARVEDDGSTPSELRESVASVEKAFAKIANLGPPEPSDVPFGRPSATSESQRGRSTAVSSVPIPPGFQSAEFVDSIAKERHNRRLAENGIPIPMSAVQMGSKTTVGAPQQPQQQIPSPSNAVSPAKAAVLQKLADLHKEMLGRIDFARQVAEHDEARFRAKAVIKRKARRLRGSEDEEDDEVEGDSEPVEADARDIDDNEDATATLEADVKDDNSNDDSVAAASSKVAPLEASNQAFLQELLETLHANGLRGRRARKRPVRRRTQQQRRQQAKSDFSSLFGAKDPAASLLDILRDERRATANMAAAAEAKQMAAGQAQTSNAPITAIPAATPAGPGYSLPVDTGDKGAPMHVQQGNAMRFSETSSRAGTREDGWSPPVPGDPVQPDPFGPSSNSFGPSSPVAQRTPELPPMSAPLAAVQPMPLLQTQLQIQQQTAQLQQQLALQQSLQQQAAVIQQQQSLNQQMLAQQQSAQPLPMANPPPLAANQVPPPPSAYFAAQAMAMQQQQQDPTPLNANNWQPGPQGYEMQPERAGGAPVNPFIPPP